MLRKVNRASAHSLDGDSGHATLPDAEAAVGLLGPHLRICLELCLQMEARVWIMWAGADLATELAVTDDRAEARRIAAMVAPPATELGMKSQHRRLIAAQR